MTLVYINNLMTNLIDIINYKDHPLENSNYINLL